MNPRQYKSSELTKAAVRSLSCMLLVFTLLAVGTTPAWGSGIDHTVRSGESLWLLANRFDTSVDAIQSINGISRTMIFAGESLSIPHTGPLHVVSRGESLYKISMWYGVSVGDIQRINTHWSSTIFPGQRLAIPSGDTRTLAQAVETRSASLGDPDMDLLARIVHSEAKGESYEGQVAVAAVVLNRVRSDLFPNTIAGVVYEPRQFEPVSNGTIYQPADATAFRAAQDALNGWDPSGGALYFFAPAKTSNAFVWSRPVIRDIGNHRFTR